MSNEVSLSGASGSVAPGDVVLVGAIPSVVTHVVFHPSAPMSAAPLRDGIPCVEVRTARGSRWRGVDTAQIGPDLRMHWTAYTGRTA